MAKKHRRETTEQSTPSTLSRSIDTGKQMRDSLLNRSRSLARRFADEPLHRLETLRNLATEDLRRERLFQVENLPTQTYRCTDGSQAHIIGREVNSPAMRKQALPPRLRYEFQNPERTLVCTRRKARRRVIFALSKAGKGGARNRRARWTDKSYISCAKGR